ncbi:metallophosphoesterase family protein [Fontivita pretiosa]|uniref:metallophosphoesterase family protein n=1 Tax=Fontivita pretiosa TaxID=2989684 RepID=UPI003D16F63E
MLIAILSDTHDRLPATVAALELLRQRNPDFYIHCGDVGSERIIDQFVGLPAALVWGNTDWDRRRLTRYAEQLGVRVLAEPLGQLELDGKHFAITHGDDPRLIRQVLERQQHDYLLMGHSHVRSDRRQGRVHIINPGALHRAAEKTVAILDTDRDEVEFLPVIA